MHDPKTVAFEIRRPWRDAPSKIWPKGYRPSIITIWHVDPERDGSDDSCGWSFPKLTKEQRKTLKDRIAWHEAQHPYFLRCRAKKWTGTRGEAEALYRGLVLLVARALGLRMSYEEAAKRAAEHIHFPYCVDRAGHFCFLPGYHTNSEADMASYREEHFLGIVCGIARGLLADRRPWYRHPRWHFWHWELQIHHIQQFKRWAFSRCAGCRKRFRFGESPVTFQWHGKGPGWFRGEKGIYHSKCSGQVVDASMKPAQEPAA